VLSESSHDAVELALVALHRALQLREGLAELARDVRERAGVFGQARTSPARARREELRADARVEADHLHHLVHVGAGRFADVGHRIHETQPRGEKGVGRMLGEFGRRNVGDDHRRAEHVVQLAEATTHGGLGGADEDAVGVEEIAHCAAFAQELGVRRHVHVVTRDDLAQSRGGADGHGRSRDEDGAGPHHAGHVASDALHIREVGRAVLRLRGRHAHEHDRCVARRGRHVGHELQTLGAKAAADEILQVGLVQVDEPVGESRDFLGVGVGTRDVVADVGKARRGRQTDVAGPDHRDALGASQPIVGGANHR